MTDQEVPKEIETLQHEIVELRKRLSDINAEKEALFSKRHDIGRQISTLIKDVKGVRSERDSLTGAVKLSKEEREKLNETIKAKIEEAKELKKDQGPIGEDPRRIKHEIERLEYKIETDVMSFDKEKQIMKTIKELKKRCAESAKEFAEHQKIRTLSREIDELRSIANSAHAKVQESAKESQHKHEHLVATSKQIDDFKKQEDVLNAQIAEKKTAMTPIAAELDEKNAKLREMRQKAGFAVDEEKKVATEKRKKKLSELQAEVTEKMKRGGKLTTDDLLIMQQGD